MDDGGDIDIPDSNRACVVNTPGNFPVIDASDIEVWHVNRLAGFSGDFPNIPVRYSHRFLIPFVMDWSRYRFVVSGGTIRIPHRDVNRGCLALRPASKSTNPH